MLAGMLYLCGFIVWGEFHLAVRTTVRFRWFETVTLWAFPLFFNHDLKYSSRISETAFDFE
jgi:hypothetical protein